MSVMDYIMMGATIVSALLWLILGIMPLSRGYNSCTEHVVGTVEGASAINYAGHHVPLCSYEVRGGIVQGGRATLLVGQCAPSRFVKPYRP